MSELTRYLTIYRTPEGKIKAHPTPLPSHGHAALATGRVLTVNAVCGSANARLFAGAMARRDIATVWGHESGYDFRILFADFTADGALIMPGMRVFNYYDREWGTIEPGQFMREDQLGPGGKLFDGWYDFIRDGDTRSFKKLNGERLAVKEN